MAKTSGGIRALSVVPVAEWESYYYEDGVRKKFQNLSKDGKKKIRNLCAKLTEEIYPKLDYKSVQLNAGNRTIKVQFTKDGINHAIEDLLINLNGKYLNRGDILNIDKLLAKSEYIDTSHRLTKPRKDGKTEFFRYKDKNHNIYFKVAHEPTQGDKKYYYLYSIVDR